MKTLLQIIIILVVFVVALDYARNGSQNEPLVRLHDDNGAFSINIRQPEKDQLKGVVHKIGNLVYREATIHNPPGDMVPDQIDDDIIKEVQEKVN